MFYYEEEDEKKKWIVAVLLATSLLFCVVACKNTAGDYGMSHKDSVLATRAIRSF